MSANDPRIARCGFFVLQGPDLPQPFYAQKYEVALGRVSKQHVDVPVSDSLKLSRQHAVIKWAAPPGGSGPGSGWVLEVLGKNGVTVNGTLHTPGPLLPLKSQDQITMGDSTFFFCLPRADTKGKQETAAPAGAPPAAQQPDTQPAAPPAAQPQWAAATQQQPQQPQQPQQAGPGADAMQQQAAQLPALAPQPAQHASAGVQHAQQPPAHQQQHPQQQPPGVQQAQLMGQAPWQGASVAAGQGVQPVAALQFGAPGAMNGGGMQHAGTGAPAPS